MSLLLPEVDQDSSPGRRSESVDPVGETLQAMLAGSSPIVVIHTTGSTPVRFLDHLVRALLLDNVRVLRATSLGGAPLGLRCLMDQVVGPGRQDDADRVEQFYAALTRPAADETRLALIIDEAHNLTDGTLRYLALVGTIGSVTPLPRQLVLVGSPQLWKRLPATGSLAADKVAACISFFSDEGAALGRDAEAPDVPSPEPTDTADRAQPPLPGATLQGSIVPAEYFEQEVVAEPPFVGARVEAVSSDASAAPGLGAEGPAVLAPEPTD